jgi:putative PIN family toxin of toxin-antitoxin system
MEEVKIILDTNVLYSGLYSSRGASYKILNEIAESRIKIVISTTLLFEYEEILKRNQSILGLSNKEIETILDNLCDYAEHQKIYFLWRPFLPDPKDDHILEVAIASGTNKIVTHNVKDFIGSRQFGIKVLTPKTFLEVLK